MATSVDSPQARSWWTTLPGAVLLVAMIRALPAWWLVAWPVLTVADPARHAGHNPFVYVYVYAHALGGTCMLVFGSLNLYIGATRRWLRPGCSAPAWVGARPAILASTTIARG
ncbi:hypothetical protein BH11PSE14_BH11PSE14_23180 [soil metagenome]